MDGAGSSHGRAGRPHAPSRPAARWLWEGAIVLLAVSTLAAAVIVPPQLGGDASPSGPAPGGVAAGVLPPEKPSIVGKFPYDGPVDAKGVFDECGWTPSTDYECIEHVLGQMVVGMGSAHAFGVLEAMTFMDAGLSGIGHSVAHGLGRVAVDAYGGPRTALEACPYVLASGCFHGVLQSFFDQIPEVTPAIVSTVCEFDDPFRTFQCLHGLGHGLMLFTNYDMDATLATCDYLPAAGVARASCYGGAFMENHVGYLDSLSPISAGGHNHADPNRPPPVFMVSKDDPHYPCNAVAETYKNACYYYQTSVALTFNGRDLRAAAKMCATAPSPHVGVCFMSLGRDVADYTRRNVEQGFDYCNAEPVGVQECVKGFVAEVVNGEADIEPGLAQCRAFPTEVKASCYEHAGFIARGTRDAATLSAKCGTAEEGYADDCRRGAAV